MLTPGLFSWRCTIYANDITFFAWFSINQHPGLTFSQLVHSPFTVTIDHYKPLFIDHYSPVVKHIFTMINHYLLVLIITSLLTGINHVIDHDYQTMIHHLVVHCPFLDPRIPVPSKPCRIEPGPKGICQGRTTCERKAPLPGSSSSHHPIDCRVLLSQLIVDWLIDCSTLVL